MTDRTKLLTYLDNDAIIAATGEPAAKAYILELRRSSYVAVSATVIYELARASRAQRDRRLTTLIEIANGYSTEQAPEVLHEVFSGFPVPTHAARSLRPIDGLRVLFEPDPPNIAEFLREGRFGRISGEPLRPMMNGIYKGVPRSSIGTFKEFFFARARAHLMSFAEMAKARGYIEKAEFAEDEIRELLERKQMFNVLAMMLATMYRATLGKGRGQDGCFSDLRTVIETAHADVFLTRDLEVYECNALVREAFPQFPWVVKLVPQAPQP